MSGLIIPRLPVRVSAPSESQIDQHDVAVQNWIDQIKPSTPETDAAASNLVAPNEIADMVSTEFARKLEVQRDEARAAAARWIPVGESLPADGVVVLAVNWLAGSRPAPKLAWFDARDAKWFAAVPGRSESVVTHWLAVPEFAVSGSADELRRDKSGSVPTLRRDARGLAEGGR